MDTKFKVVNIVAVQNTGFGIDIDKLYKSKFLLYDTAETTTVRYVAIKPPGASKQITIFYNGNMITPGNRTVEEARQNLQTAKDFLEKFKLNGKKE